MCCVVTVVSEIEVNWKWRDEQEIRGIARGDLEGLIRKDN